jgi:hypothetical protein
MRGVPDFIVERQIHHWTLDDTVEFFNLILGTQLTSDEKLDLVAFCESSNAAPGSALTMLPHDLRERRVTRTRAKAQSSEEA